MKKIIFLVISFTSSIIKSENLPIQKLFKQKIENIHKKFENPLDKYILTENNETIAFDDDFKKTLSQEVYNSKRAQLFPRQTFKKPWHSLKKTHIEQLKKIAEKSYDPEIIQNIQKLKPYNGKIETAFINNVMIVGTSAAASIATWALLAAFIL